MKPFRLAGLLIATPLLWLAVNQYLFCPVFVFNDPVPFAGSRLYNPYSGTDSSKWMKCNFHAHCNAWKGFTNGHGCADDIRKAYDSIGYNISLVSNYQKIDGSRRNEPGFIPAYEHGYNINKVHQLVIGDEKITWLDYLYPQTRSNKQYLLNKLSANPNALVVINHPEVRNGFTPEDMKYLSGYQCMEVLSPAAISLQEWDAALSAGKPVFIVANDDAHNVFHKYSIGRFCTWVNIDTMDRNGLIKAMKKGNSYAMRIAEIPGESLPERRNRLKNNLPKLKNFQLVNDTIRLELSQPAAKIVFTGSNGRELSSMFNSTRAEYIIQDADQYARATAYFEDGTELYLNPVYRYSNDPFHEMPFVINNANTTIYLLAGCIILAFWGLLLYRYLFAGTLRDIGRRFAPDRKLRRLKPQF